MTYPKFSGSERYHSSEVYSAWYYYEAKADPEGIYRLFSNHPYIRTNWVTPGNVPIGRGIVIKTVRLLGLERRLDELDTRNWLRLRIASREDPLIIPPWVLYGGMEIHLPTPVALTELMMFHWHLHIDASLYSLAPSERGGSPPLTLIMGVSELRHF